MFKKLFSGSNERPGLALSRSPRRSSASHLLALAVLLTGPAVWAFPPAPPHTIYGVVRDQIGNPLNDGAEVILEASSGTRVRTFVLAHKDLPLNYSLEVPMDAGLTADRYSPTALMPAAPFRIRVRLGQSTFLPMEMAGDLSSLGAPGARTRIDLTLGVDEDGNGLPDAWEKAVAAFLGRAWQSGQIRPDDLYPGTGLTYREVYLAGTYAMSPTDGFALQIVNAPGTVRKLAFTVVKGRRYTIQVSDKLADGWRGVPFRLLTSGAALQDFYHAAETRRIEIEAPLSGDSPARFYRLIVE